MRLPIITAIALLFGASLFAQSGQNRVLLQQIAALKVYGDYLHKGYTIINKGLNTIGDLKDGELNLHSDYFESLGLVNPELAGHVRVADIISLQVKIVKAAGFITTNETNEILLSANERAYYERVKERLLKSCTDGIDRLYDIITDELLIMEDAQRMEAIEKLYQEMQGDYNFIKQFTDEMRLLMKSRQREVHEAKKSKQLYNIN